MEVGNLAEVVYYIGIALIVISGIVSIITRSYKIALLSLAVVVVSTSTILPSVSNISERTSFVIMSIATIVALIVAFHYVKY